MSFNMLMRHGQAESNLTGVLPTNPEGAPLTKQGREQAAYAVPIINAAFPGKFAVVRHRVLAALRRQNRF